MNRYGRWIAMTVVAAVGWGCEQQVLVQVDGSSTVAPATTVAAEMFSRSNPGIHVTVGVSGTGGGFKKFLDESPRLRTDINDASRPIEPEELARAEKLGVAFIELPLAFDGIAVTVNPSNDFCDDLTIEELRRIWEPESALNNWKDVREGFPDLRLKLYGPGTDSGTFDCFVEAVVGERKRSRSDFTASENDNVLVQGISGDPGALGYFGFSYYEANKERLKLLAIDNGDGQPVRPSLDTIRAGIYRPLSRPMFLYVNAASLDRPEVRTFVEFYLRNAPEIVEHPSVNYVAMPDDVYAMGLERLASRTTGSVMAGAREQGVSDLAQAYGIRK